MDHLVASARRGHCDSICVTGAGIAQIPGSYPIGICQLIALTGTWCDHISAMYGVIIEVQHLNDKGDLATLFATNAFKLGAYRAGKLRSGVRGFDIPICPRLSKLPSTEDKNSQEKLSNFFHTFELLVKS